VCYHLDLDKPGMAVRFELAMLVSGWMQLKGGYESLDLDVARPEEEA
jgi:hypothetical protein